MSNVIPSNKGTSKQEELTGSAAEIKVGKITFPISKRISEITGRKESVCDCEFCRAQCNTPCLGTPEDIMRLLEAGYRKKLHITLWCVGMIVGRLPIPIPMVQAEQTDKGCIFQRNGLCELHDTGLKPTEGRLSHHTLNEGVFVFEKSLAWNVAREWINPGNHDLIKKILQFMESEE